jgi:hypothetical protein
MQGNSDLTSKKVSGKYEKKRNDIILTRYKKIPGTNMTRETYRKPK